MRYPVEVGADPDAAHAAAAEIVDVADREGGKEADGEAAAHVVSRWGSARLIQLYMRSLRCRLVALALAWLGCQLAGLVCAPVLFALTEVPTSDLHECCRNLAPGQTCPMHHTPHDEERGAEDEPGGCVMRAACDSDLDVAALALAGTLGAPVSGRHVVALAERSVHALCSSRLPHPLSLPDAPPPRA
jgi:hypothetical protein